MTEKKFIPARPIPHSLNTLDEFDAFIARAESSPTMTFEEIETSLTLNISKFK